MGDSALSPVLKDFKHFFRSCRLLQYGQSLQFGNIEGIALKLGLVRIGRW